MGTCTDGPHAVRRRGFLCHHRKRAVKLDACQRRLQCAKRPELRLRFEYGLIAALISVVIITAITAVSYIWTARTCEAACLKTAGQSWLT
jgi:hypothetical protein